MPPFPASLRRTARTVLATGLVVSVVGLSGCAKQSAVPPVAAPVPAGQTQPAADQPAVDQPAVDQTPAATTDPTTQPSIEPTPTSPAPTAQASTAPDTSLAPQSSATRSTAARSAAPTGTPSPAPTRGSVPTPTGSASSAAPTAPAAPTPTPTSTPSKSAAAAPTGGVPVLDQGAQGDRVRDLQARLKQLDWFTDPVTGYYGSATRTAVNGFQAKRGLPTTGVVDQPTLDQLTAMTRQPSTEELTGRPTPTPTPTGAQTPQPGQSAQTPPAAAGLDPRCLSGRVLCISKKDNSLRWVVDGQVQKTMDVRFGVDEMPTREGAFSVFWKSRDHVSTIYHTPMPYAMFFSGGQAVHYSPDFAARGYTGGSHGCVNVRDKAGVTWLFDQVREGDKVIVYS
ncbi:L,D-transpeptidase family protein [Granulicoccus phenolivorans]|uniref:L,D-transpeptidase family protein n=1 Tax=Granulicoccus phenolivorans TaxID=266854 RepID=UPI0003F576F4|nr:L,D-transpeptidase family protein [Granulicoccus phenolivorans]